MTLYPLPVKFWKETPRQLSGAASLEENMTECLIRNNINASTTIPKTARDDSLDCGSIPPAFRMDYICSSPEIYTFMCLTGICIPQLDRDSSYKDRFLYLWSILLHLLMVGLPILYPIRVSNFSLPLFWPLDFLSSTEAILFLIFNIITLYSRYIFLIAAVYYMRGELMRPFSDPTTYHLYYPAAISSALTIGYRLLILLSFCLFIFMCCSIGTFTDWDPLQGMQLLLILLLAWIPSFPLIAITAFIISEQRINHSILHKIEQQDIREKKSLTVKEYKAMKINIDDRNANLPINLLVCTSIINTFALLSLVIFFSTSDTTYSVNSHGSFWIIVDEILEVICFYGRETIILLVLLYEIAQVNELGEQLARTLAWQEDWGCIEGGQGDQPLKQHEQVQLVTMMMLAPLGCKIFAYRPSRFQLLVQMGSIIISVTVAICSRFIASGLIK